MRACPPDPRSAATRPSTTTSKRSSDAGGARAPDRRCGNSTRRPREVRASTTASRKRERSRVRGDPSASRDSVKAEFLRFPRPQTVSSSGGSSAAPSGNEIDRDARKRPHAVVARLAVDVGEVVGVGVGLDDAPRGEVGREEPRPRAHVHVGGGGEHAVEVEEHGRERQQPLASVRKGEHRNRGRSHRSPCGYRGWIGKRKSWGGARHFRNRSGCMETFPQSRVRVWRATERREIPIPPTGGMPARRLGPPGLLFRSDADRRSRCRSVPTMRRSTPVRQAARHRPAE